MVNRTNSQLQFLQLVCVVLVMVTLMGVVAAYVLYRDVHNLQSEAAEAKAQADRFRGEVVRLQEDVETLKNLMGYPLSEVGNPDDVDASTIVGSVQKDINKYAGTGTLPKPTLRNAIIELYARLQVVTKERNTLKASLEKLSATDP